MIVLYGIPNCDTMKKAKKWLEKHHVEYTFHDYKKSGISEKKLKQWAKAVGYEALVNRRGTTWRKLDEKTRDNLDEQSATRLMIQNPSLIKRPVLENGKNILVGFDENKYKKL